MREVLLSVGIDIGTSTTQVIFSNITIENLSSTFSVPRIEIVDKEIIYRSEIYFTPLLSPTEINMSGVRDIVDKEYSKFGVDKKQIATGAVVITGETARKRNANEVLMCLSEFAGDFVVATAGPDLESIIAGRGAGADLFSKNHSAPAANYDIGGGTSNFALFKNGDVITTGCLDIGGRQLKLDPSSKVINYIAPKIKELIAARGIKLEENSKADLNELKKLTQAMCELLEMSLGLRDKDSFYPRILTIEDRDISLETPIKNICFSGGVADYIYNGIDQDNLFKFGDIGILLGATIKNSKELTKINQFRSNETIRATVVGAGEHITEISGSTITYDSDILPIKNLPILKLTKEEETPENIQLAIESKLDWFKTDNELQPVAIAFNGTHSPSFKHVVTLAESLLLGIKSLMDNGFPIVIICENDMAKILGQTLKARMPAKHRLICIDAIRVDNGDYIDIGLPAGNGSVLPVIIKTLLFK